MSESNYAYKEKSTGILAEELKKRRSDKEKIKSEFKALSVEEQKRVISEKISNSKLGSKHSQEVRKRIGLAKKGKTYEELYGEEKAGELKRALKERVYDVLRTPEAIKAQKESRKGYKHSQETIEKIAATKLKNGNANINCYRNKTPEEIKIIVEKQKETKRLNPELVKGGRSEWYDTPIGKVQGTYERNYINKLISENKELPTKPIGVKTPHGTYFPDFEFTDRYIEIKSVFTYEIYQGKRNPLGSQTPNTTQKQKLEWVSNNVKPVEILVFDKKGNIVLDIIGKVL